MPRVTIHTKSPRMTKRPYVCAAQRCEAESREILPGQRYYQWAIKSSYGGTTYRQAEANRDIFEKEET